MTADAIVTTIIWNIAALTGMGFSVTVLPQYWLARRGAREIQKRMGTQEAKDAVRLVKNYLWAEVSRLICHLISLVLGIQVFFIPRMPEPQRTHSAAIYGTEVLLGFIAINVLTVHNSIRAYLSWRKR